VFDDDTFWLTQKAMGELFNTTTPNVNMHLKNLFVDGELPESSVIKDFLITAADGKNYNTQFYNLDAIIAVGYRVNSKQATQFRIWATQTLREYIVKGFVLNDEMLKNGRAFGKDYFRELLERVRSIRASERRIWQQITDIFAECSIDYTREAQTTHDFYATVQNKFHYAITGQTAAEIIYAKADAKKDKMGLLAFKNSPDGRVLKSDVTVAKNYLPEKEIKQLERAVTSYFDYIERLIENGNTFTMEQFAVSINKFLEFGEYRILQGNGTISKADADAKATCEYDIFNKTQKIESDFDKVVKMLAKKTDKKDN
jgi:hypothetical protein